MALSSVLAGGGVVIVLVCGVLLCGGCSNLDFQPGPIQRVTDQTTKGKPFVAGSTATNAVDVARSDRLKQVLTEWIRVGSGKSEYRVGYHDLLEIGVLALEEPGKVAVLQREVSDAGAIAMPMVGEVAVSDKTVTEIGEAVTAAYRGKYIRDPQVTVKVADYRSAAVIVTGAVGQPGVYYLKRSVSSALEVLFMAGGVVSAAGDELVILRADKAVAAPKVEAAVVATNSGSALLAEMLQLDSRMAQPPSGGAGAEADGEVLTPIPVEVELDGANVWEAQRILTVNLRDLIDLGDPKMNLPVFSGDVLSVAPRKATYVNVFGYVRGPGRIPVSKPNEVSALTALAMVGGPTQQGRVENSYLIRSSPQGNKMIKVDLAQIARGVRPDFFLEPGDTLVVGSGLLMKILEVFRVGGSATYNVAPVP